MLKENNYETMQVGDGYYLKYRKEENGFRGLHPVNLMLCKNDNELVCEITDTTGHFIKLPDVSDGKWKNELSTHFFYSTRYVVKISNYINDLLCFAWMLQPDGMYWVDEDGFGMAGDDEIWLYALMNKKGEFITPFSEKNICNIIV